MVKYHGNFYKLIYLKEVKNMVEVEEEVVETQQRYLPDPIVINEKPKGSVPFLTRFAKKPDLKIPDIRMGNQTYLGITSPGVGDYANDDQ